MCSLRDAEDPHRTRSGSPRRAARRHRGRPRSRDARGGRGVVTSPERLARQIATWLGLDLARGGRLDGLERVLRQRVAGSGLASAADYVAGLTGPDDPEVIHLLDTITVGHTWFFRDLEQAEAIVSVLRALTKGRSRPEVWVAGCSTGEDAYTVALLAGAAGVDVEVLGTDVNPRALERARAARYADWSRRQGPPAYA